MGGAPSWVGLEVWLIESQEGKTVGLEVWLLESQEGKRIGLEVWLLESQMMGERGCDLGD